MAADTTHTCDIVKFRRLAYKNLRTACKSSKRSTLEGAEIEAVGIIETSEVAPAIYAGDAAAKAASVRLIEARNQPGAKGLVVLTGEVGAVRAAVAAGVATVKEGMLVAEVVIPYAHRALLAALIS